MTGEDELVEDSLFAERGVPLCPFIEGGGGNGGGAGRDIDVDGRYRNVMMPQD